MCQANDSWGATATDKDWKGKAWATATTENCNLTPSPSPARRGESEDAGRRLMFPAPLSFPGEGLGVRISTQSSGAGCGRFRAGKRPRQLFQTPSESAGLRPPVVLAFLHSRRARYHGRRERRAPEFSRPRDWAAPRWPGTRRYARAAGQYPAAVIQEWPDGRRRPRRSCPAGSPSSMATRSLRSRWVDPRTRISRPNKIQPLVELAQMREFVQKIEIEIAIRAAAKVPLRQHDAGPVDVDEGVALIAAGFAHAPVPAGESRAAGSAGDARQGWTGPHRRQNLEIWDALRSASDRSTCGHAGKSFGIGLSGLQSMVQTRQSRRNQYSMLDIVYETSPAPRARPSWTSIAPAAGGKKNPWRAAIPQMIRGSLCFLLAREPGGRVVGMGRVISDGRQRRYIQDVVVLPEFRGRGIGRTIIRRLTDRCVAAGLTWIGLVAEPGHARSSTRPWDTSPSLGFQPHALPGAFLTVTAFSGFPFAPIEIERRALVTDFLPATRNPCLTTVRLRWASGRRFSITTTPSPNRIRSCSTLGSTPIPSPGYCNHWDRFPRPCRKPTRPRPQIAHTAGHRIGQRRVLGATSGFCRALPRGRESRQCNYVYRTEDLAALAGSRYAKKRNLVQQATRIYAWRIEPLGPQHSKECLEVGDDIAAKRTTLTLQQESQALTNRDSRLRCARASGTAPAH